MNYRQREILSFIDYYWLENWTSPTVREIGNAVGLSSSSAVHSNLMQLTRAGYLERKRLSSARTLYRVVKSSAGGI